MVFPHAISLFKASAQESQPVPAEAPVPHATGMGVSRKSKSRRQRNVIIVHVAQTRQRDAYTPTDVPTVGWGWLPSLETTSPGQSCSRYS